MEVTIPLDYDGDTLKVIAEFNPDSEEQVDYSKVRYASPHASPYAICHASPLTIRRHLRWTIAVCAST
jgi:hypothetical protein